MSDCCKNKSESKKRKFDFILWGALTPVVISYFAFLFFPEQISSVASLEAFSQSVFELMNKMAWGLVIGIVFVGILAKIPRELVIAALGKGGTFSGILRATGAGVMLDMCSHGILLVGMKLYERGASLGQVMAFLIASPWNSISLTLILWALVGFWWMLAFLILSVLIAIVSGVIFDKLVKRGTLPANPNKVDIPKGYKFWHELWKTMRTANYYPTSILNTLWHGIKGSRMILKWIFFGIILASAIRTFLPPESFETLFGPTLAGLGLTLVVATIMEVCSEGSTPIAADILTRASAPGNSFAFLMTGVSTDYTEMLAIKETTKSWKIAFFLPLVTLPQVIAIAIAINFLG
ncbi:ATPase [Candidatus Peregrinibacteria bacterium]|jgi:uncharacterized protein|nr:ATPase [Candidatus Peregrinibacteria bacterium]MBT7736772.1 ATPase [Candidatus Peregrinibacteria bacterium]